MCSRYIHIQIIKFPHNILNQLTRTKYDSELLSLHFIHLMLNSCVQILGFTKQIELICLFISSSHAFTIAGCVLFSFYRLQRALASYFSVALLVSSTAFFIPTWNQSDDLFQLRVLVGVDSKNARRKQYMIFFSYNQFPMERRYMQLLSYLD